MRHLSIAVLCFSSIYCTALAASAESLPGEWFSFGGPIDISSAVHAIVPFGVGIAIGGDFERAAYTDVSFVALYENSRFRAVDKGLSGSVYSMLPTENGLVCGGWFLGVPPRTSFVDLWNGSAWVGLGDGLNNRVNALIEYENQIVAGGRFTMSGFNPLGRLASFNGLAWNALGGFGFDDDVNALAIYGGDLIAAGEFTSVDGMPAVGIAAWNGSQWQALSGGGIESGSRIRAMAVVGGDLFVGGSFQTIGGDSIAYVARWDGADWHSLGAGLNGEAVTLAAFDSQLAVGGLFTIAGGVSANRVAAWNMAAWSALGQGADAEVTVLREHESHLYAGGWFQTIDGDSLAHLARWNGSAWEELPPEVLPGGAFGTVRTIIQAGSDIVVGGTIVSAGTTAVDRVARLVSGEWESMGTLPGTVVWSLAELNDTVFVGGNGVSVQSFHEGSQTWHEVAGGLDNTVTCVHSIDGVLYAGGNFSLTSTGDTVRNAAMRVGDKFVQIGALGATVRDFIEYGGDLIACGDFQTDQGTGTVLNRVARWDGSEWQPMGGGMDDQVHALAIHEGELIAAGWFDNAGGQAASCAARWNGTDWVALSLETFTGIAFDVTSYNGELYLCGSLGVLNGLQSGEIVRWTGTSWGSMDGGADAQVRVMQEIDLGDGPSLAAGGGFGNAGLVHSSRIARWKTVIPTGVAAAPFAGSRNLYLGRNRPNPFNPTTVIEFLVPQRGRVGMEIYDITGRLITTLIDGTAEPGLQSVTWAGQNSSGRPVGSGVYFVRLQIGDTKEVRKMSLIR